MEIRRIKFGANIVIFSIMAIALWAGVNYINSRHYHRFDLTKNRQYSLSPKTIAILKDLKKPIHITMLYRPGTPIYRQVKDLLDEYAGKSNKITVEDIDAERDRAEVELLAKRLNIGTFELNTVIFECGKKAKHVSASEVIERAYGRRQASPPKFKGEEAFTSAILECTQEKQSIICFTGGHGERDIAGTMDAGMSYASELLKRQNFRVEKIMLLGKEKVPDDCEVLGIIGPGKKFFSEEVKLLSNYLSSGGKLLVMIDPLTDCGLSDLLGEWGIKLGNDIVLDPVRRLPFMGPAAIYVGEYPYHEITGKMKGVAVIFSLARTVSFSDPGKSLQGTEIVRTSKEAWGEVDAAAKKAKYDEGKDKKGPVSIAAAVSMRKLPGAGKEEAGKTRLVVFGDSDIVSNAQIKNLGNSDLFLNSINWLAEKEKLISIGPKSVDTAKVILSAKQMRLIFWSTIAGLPFLAIVMGVVVWWRRRK